jgi:Bacterial Ig-like domain (group 1)
MKHRNQWLAGLAAVALALITTATAFGYAGETAGAVTITRLGGTVKCGVNITVTATVVDAKGKPISGQPVFWSFTAKPSRADIINASPTFTNSKGVATTTVFLACVPGSRHLRAVADAVSGSAVLNVSAAGLPNTSTLPGGTPAPEGLPVIGTLLAVLAMAAGGVLAVRRISLSRR